MPGPSTDSHRVKRHAYDGSGVIGRPVRSAAKFIPEFCPRRRGIARVFKYLEHTVKSRRWNRRYQDVSNRDQAARYSVMGRIGVDLVEVGRAIYQCEVRNLDDVAGKTVQPKVANGHPCRRGSHGVLKPRGGDIRNPEGPV